MTSVRHGVAGSLREDDAGIGLRTLGVRTGCFVKKGVSHKDTIIVVVHVDDLLGVGKRKHFENFFVQLKKTLKLKRAECIENGKSVLFLGDYITKFKDKITLKKQRCVCGQHAHIDGHGELQTDKHTDGAKGVCSKRRRRDA